MPSSEQHKIVFAAIGSLGDLYPFLALGQALMQRGHAVAVSTTLNHKDAVEKAGLSFHAMRPHPPSDAAFGKKFTHPTKGPAFVFKDYLGPSVRETYEDLLAATSGADLLVSQSLVLAAPLVAETTGIRWISVVLQPFSFFSAFDPPRVPMLPFVWSARVRPETLCVINKYILEYAKKWTLRWVEPVRNLRQSLRIGDGSHPIYEGQHSPLSVLAMFPPLFGRPQEDWPPQTIQTGEVLYDDPSPLPCELEAFLNAGPLPVVFTLGSSSCRNPGRFFDASIKAARKAGLRAILITGSASSERVQNTNDLFVCRYAPYGKVFPEAAVIVHSGGIGTTVQATISGRPQLIVPFAHDQTDNARRAEASGVAEYLSKRTYRSGLVARCLKRMLGNNSMRARCAETARLMKLENGTCNALREIEKSLHV